MIWFGHCGDRYDTVFPVCQDNNSCYTYTVATENSFIVLHRKFGNSEEADRWEKVDFVESEDAAKELRLNPGVRYSVGDLFGYIKIEEVSDIFRCVSNNQLFVATPKITADALSPKSLYIYEQALGNTFYYTLNVCEFGGRDRLHAAAATVLSLSTKFMRGDREFSMAIKMAMEYVADCCFGEKTKEDLEEADEYIKKQEVNPSNVVFFDACREILSLTNNEIVYATWNILSANIPVSQTKSFKSEIIDIVRHYIPYNIVALGKLGVILPMIRVPK